MNQLLVKLLDTSFLDIVREVRPVLRRKINNFRTKQYKSNDNIKFSGKLVCGKEPEDFRDFQRVESVSNWAQARGVQFEIIKPEDFAKVSWIDVNAVWMPQLNPGENKDYKTRCKEMLNIPKHIPLILDIKSHADHPWINPIKTYLRDRPMACRQISPHDTGDLFQVKVQYNHFPVELPDNALKDVIIIDIHHWESLSRHIQVTGLLEEFGKSYETACKMAQCELKFFLTSFTRLEPYFNATDNFTKNNYGMPDSNGTLDNPLDIIRDNLIPPAETRKDFSQVLSRARLFITFHYNLTDMLLFEALANEIPTAIISNSIIEERPRKLWIPNKYEIPGYDRWACEVEENLISLHGTDFSFLKKNWPPLNSKKILRNVFYHSWDTLWKWVEG